MCVTVAKVVSEMSREENQLFVGRLPRGTRSSELEDVFYKYGKMTRCDVKQGGST